MAEFLTTSAITYKVEEIIKNAQDKLILVSPYLKFDNRVKELVEDKHRLPKTDIRLIFGKSGLQPDVIVWLNRLTRMRINFRENLHAKCYLNEDEALVTSMNLYEFSMRNNDEMGILVSREHDEEMHGAIREEVDRIERGSQDARLSVLMAEHDKRPPTPKASQKATGTRGRTTATAPEVGFCIRCKTEIPAKPMQPYCKRCFASWNRYKNEDYEEKHCHTCGRDHEATMKKPACLDCFKKYRNVLEFAAS